MRLRDLPLVSVLTPVLLLPLLTGVSQQATPNRKSSPPAPPPARYSAEGAVPMPDDRADDSYAIYARLMPGDIFASLPPDQTTQWAIASITVNENDRNPAVPPQGQLKPPPENPRGFQEAVQDYETNKTQRVQLTQSAFHLNHAFSLLAPNEVAALRAEKTGTDASESASDFPGVTFFSEVYFDSKHQAALVYMNDWCAHLCATGSWVYLEKQGGQWVRCSGVVVPGV